jgi:hypothetical protein
MSTGGAGPVKRKAEAPEISQVEQPKKKKKADDVKVDKVFRGIEEALEGGEAPAEFGRKAKRMQP